MRSNQTRAVSILTSKELEVRQNVFFDLAAGYPLREIPEWLKNIAYENRYTNMFVGPSDIDYDTIATNDLVDSVIKLFECVNYDRKNIFITFSGSVALERAITAFVDTRRHFCVSPEIDIIAELTREATGDRPERIALEPSGFGGQTFDSLLRSASGVITFSTPNNPFGHALSADQLRILSNASCEAGGGLIIDQCFALSAGGTSVQFSLFHT